MSVERNRSCELRSRRVLLPPPHTKFTRWAWTQSVYQRKRASASQQPSAQVQPSATTKARPVWKGVYLNFQTPQRGRQLVNQKPRLDTPRCATVLAAIGGVLR